MNKDDWKNEFREFLVEKGKEVPSSLFFKVQRQIESELSPSFRHILPKAIVVQALSAASTLFVCPQLGIGPLGGGHGLMKYFMEAGTVGCTLLCAGLFLGFGAAVSAILFRPEELRALQKQGLSYFSVFGAVSFVVLMVLSGVNGTHSDFFSFSYTATWWLGGSLIAYLVFSGLVRLRVRSLGV